jgi:hypothetical protein
MRRAQFVQMFAMNWQQRLVNEAMVPLPFTCTGESGVPFCHSIKKPKYKESDPTKSS